MTYHSRIPADSEYLHALGRAVYNFTYLEWIIIWTIAKLAPDGFNSVPKGRPAAEIAKALTNAIKNTHPPLPHKLRGDLVRLDQQYREAIKRRNKLFHSHPITAADLSQQLYGGGIEWPMDALYDAAKFFEEVAIEGNEIFHGDLAKVRP